MSRFINLEKEKITLFFGYDKAVIEAIRTIDGRIWNKFSKQWEIPKENLDDVLEVLLPLKFEMSDAVRRTYERSIEIQKEFDEIKASSDQPYEGTLPLYDFQRKGAMFLKNMPHALLADVPGLGKSIQSLASVEGSRKVLIFCPATLKYSWKKEIEKWQPNEHVVVIDGNKKTRNEQWINGLDGMYINRLKIIPKYVIANYELLLHDFELLLEHDHDVIICDEATRISNPNAQTTANLKKLRSKKRIALTGTPISNKPDDIWSIIDWLIPRYLGSYYQFKAKYCEVSEDWGMNGNYSRISGYKNLDKLAAKVDRFMLRRTKEEVFDDFPPKTIENIVFNLSDTERDLYVSIKEQLYQEIKELSLLDTRTLSIIPVKMLRLKQCTGHTKLVGASIQESSKLATLKEIIKPIIESGEKIIIFTQFAEMLHILCDELKSYLPWAIYGDVDSVDRMKRVQEFNDTKGGQIIIMTEAGAYGLNMQSASYVIHYDAPWSISKLQQREDRAHRIGNNKPVTVYNLIAQNTIDEYILKLLAKKNKVAVNILQDAERMEGVGLSPEDIKEILRL